VLGWCVVDEVQVLSLAVDPCWRRRGVGRRLLNAYLDTLRSEGVRQVTLEVRASNEAAHEFYREFGFEVQGERPRYYPGGESALLLGAEL
jgi:ribosomal-protein-alanine N-acetyltransferase